MAGKDGYWRSWVEGKVWEACPQTPAARDGPTLTSETSGFFSYQLCCLEAMASDGCALASRRRYQLWGRHNCLCLSFQHGQTHHAHSQGTGETPVVWFRVFCHAGLWGDFGKFWKTGEENGKEEREGEQAGSTAVGLPLTT